MHKSGAAATAAAIDNAMEAMLDSAVRRQATDIHIEPRERNIVVRFRVDGLLREVAKLPLPSLEGIIENLKARADLNADETRAPQNGSFMLAAKQLDVAVQIATMPTINGEKISVHLSPQVSEPATLEALGYWGDMLNSIEQAAATPNGLIIATSPDHTGTTMSLLGIVHLINNPALNIATLEDPIEHQVAGINQSQVDPAAGVGFASGLQALLKQDPNVVMIGDMHEQRTVELALEAALGGHLILGGLHTSSAAQGVSHLLHMHVEPYLVAAALKESLGQRYVRRLCPSCRESYKPEESLRKDLKQLLKSSGINSMRALHELEIKAAADHIGASDQNSFGTSETGIVKLWRAHPEGCPHCHFTGFSGRTGVCEVLVNSEGMKRLIASGPTTDEMQHFATSEGMLPLQVDGLIKALRGLTTFEEILPLTH